MKRNITIILIIIAVALTGFLFWNNTKSKTGATTYQTEKATKQTLVASVTASGQVSGTNIASVTTQASGTIKQIFVKEGDIVKAGQKILEITPDIISQQKMTQAYASYLSAKNALDTSTINLYTLQSAEFAANDKFMKDAVERDLATNDPVYIQQHADWLAAEAKYKQQSAVIAQSRAALNNASLAYQLTSPVVTAPTSGIITNISSVGTAIASSSSNNSSSNTVSEEKVAIIENESTPTITVNLSEIDVIKVKIGQRATITLDSMPDKTFTGKITALDKIGAQTSGVTSYPSTITLDTDNENILPNMAANASIIIETKDNALTVPTAAIQNQNGTSIVRILKNGQPENVTVETGIASDTETEILSGIAEGDEVITSSSSTATSTQSSGNTSVFGGSFGGGAFRGVTGGGGNTRIIQRN
jgi:macrolide-specific efflux system membrane fusion protein